LEKIIKYLGSMTERPVFTVSTSFYKRKRYIENIYECLKRQTYPYWEWVVTDDFSDGDCAKERLLEIAKSDSRVRYYHQSRKMELYWNPNLGSRGNIVLQLDCDDLMYDNVLEMYAKYFKEDPELMGITCGYTSRVGMVDYHGISCWDIFESATINFAQMARAWRNTIPIFDEGDLKHYQNDTNIWRQVEARGKVLFIPREMFIYNYSPDSISKEWQSPENTIKVEEERVFIEGRFPSLHKGDECSFSLKYLPIHRLSWAFYLAEFNTSTTPQDILFIKTDAKPYEKQLLNELYYDHRFHYNVDSCSKCDEIIAYLNVDTYEYLREHMPLIREKFKGTTFRFFMDSTVFEVGDEDIMLLVGDVWGWSCSSGLYHGNLVL
tara:strand:- start:2886 stop:4022 length:1137 start_codon:yes stop_codon:yes gene_type:complete